MKLGVIIWNVGFLHFYSDWSMFLPHWCWTCLGQWDANGCGLSRGSWACPHGQRHLNKNNFPPVSAAWVLNEHVWGKPQPSSTRSRASQLAARSMHIHINASCNRSPSSGVTCCTASVYNTDWLICLEFPRARVTTWWEHEAAWRKRPHSQAWLWVEVRSNRKQEKKSWPRLPACTFMDRQLCRDKLLLTDLPMLLALSILKAHCQLTETCTGLWKILSHFFSQSFFMQKTDVLEEMNKQTKFAT